MLLLWRTHDCHRVLCTLEAATRTTRSDNDDPGGSFMTRHGMAKTQPQASRLRQPTRMRPWRSLLSTGLLRVGCQAVKAARIRNAATCPSPSIHFLPAGSPPHASAEKRNLHSISLWSAGSFLGDFRMPAGARNSSRIRTVRFCLVGERSGQPLGN